VQEGEEKEEDESPEQTSLLIHILGIQLLCANVMTYNCHTLVIYLCSFIDVSLVNQYYGFSKAMVLVTDNKISILLKYQTCSGPSIF
jgi:hypothetical protein